MIQVHGVFMLYQDGIYYWYGENKKTFSQIVYDSKVCMNAVMYMKISMAFGVLSKAKE